MGRRGKWFGAVKKVFSAEPKEKKKGGQKKRNRSKKSWACGSCSNFDPESFEEYVPNNPILPPQEDVKLSAAENEKCRHAYSVALASAVAAEAAAIAAQAAAEVARLTKPAKFPTRPKEEIAAIKIQTAFRGYLARSTLRALRGFDRLKSLTNSDSVKRQAAATLRCVQTLARVQTQVRSRRIRMSEEHQALKRHLQLKHERELEKLKMSEEWDDTIRSKEQIEAQIQHKQEASVRRERALAYAFSHQWRSSSRPASATFMDPDNPQWGWSWMDRWMSARPWDSRNIAGKDLNNRTPNRTAPPPTTTTATKSKSASPINVRTSSSRYTEDDSYSVKSDHPRRHSIAGLSAADEEIINMGPARSPKAKFFNHSFSSSKIDTSSVSSAKKRLSFPTAVPQSPSTARRNSGPVKV